MPLTQDQLAAVQPSQLSDWLRGSGFMRVERPEPWARHFAVFHREATEGIEAFDVGVPVDPSFADYARRVSEALQGLGERLGRDPSSLLRDVLSSDQDTIRLRAIGPTLTDGRVPVSIGARLIESARELLLAAACSAVQPKAAYQGRRYDEAKGFLDLIKLTPPERGSFVISAMTPVGRAAHDGAGAEGVEIPFARKATEMLATAIDATASAARRAAIDGEYEPLLGSADVGVSANLCEAIAKFVDGEIVTELEVRMRWAGSRPTPRIGAIQRTFTRESADVLREAAGRIRATAPREDFRVTGAVVRLESTDSAAGGTVVVASQVDGKTRGIRMWMDTEDYGKAIASHEDRGTLLTCEGELVFAGQTATLMHVRDVEVVRIDPA